MRNPNDRVIEAPGDGDDRVFAAVSYTLTAGQAIELLSTTDDAGVAAIGLIGNEFDNLITGNAGSNVLDGGGGVNTLSGLAGNDWYFVRNPNDRVIEAPGDGDDRVFAAVSYTLTAGQAIESLSTTDDAGVAAIGLIGNEFDNLITGKLASNVLDGGGGVNTLSGLAGNDWYFVRNPNDRVIEAPGDGDDRVFAAVSYTLTAGQAIESLSTTDDAGVAAIGLIGNEFDNLITGNAGKQRPGWRWRRQHALGARRRRLVLRAQTPATGCSKRLVAAMTGCSQRSATL